MELKSRGLEVLDNLLAAVFLCGRGFNKIVKYLSFLILNRRVFHSDFKFILRYNLIVGQNSGRGQRCSRKTITKNHNFC
jgi:hypothetical protein